MVPCICLQIYMCANACQWQSQLCRHLFLHRHTCVQVHASQAHASACSCICACTGTQMCKSTCLCMYMRKPLQQHMCLCKGRQAVHRWCVQAPINNAHTNQHSSPLCSHMDVQTRGQVVIHSCGPELANLAGSLVHTPACAHAALACMHTQTHGPGLAWAHLCTLVGPRFNSQMCAITSMCSHKCMHSHPCTLRSMNSHPYVY